MRSAAPIALVLALSWAPAASGQIALPPSVCKLLADPAERLKCYDEIMGAPGSTATPEPQAAPQAPAQPVIRKWAVNEERSALDDSPAVAGTLRATDSAGTLVLRCREDTTDVIFLPERFAYFSDDDVRVIVRLGQGGPAESRWRRSNDNRAVFASQPITWIRALPENSRLVIRAHGHNGTHHDAIFELGEVGAVRDKIAAACKWPAVTARPPARPIPR